MLRVSKLLRDILRPLDILLIVSTPVLSIVAICAASLVLSRLQTPIKGLRPTSEGQQLSPSERLDASMSYLDADL